MAAAIEVIAIRRLDGKSTVKAFIDVKIGGITLKGCKIVQQPEQRAWLAMPSVKTDHGWQNVVEISKPLREAATEVVLAAWGEA
jgi:DNA-binding cell septation regulator SpoVG